jgi:hypothetical protein
MMNRAAYGRHYRGLSLSENVKVRELRKTDAEKLKRAGARCIARTSCE